MNTGITPFEPPREACTSRIAPQEIVRRACVALLVPGSMFLFIAGSVYGELLVVAFFMRVASASRLTIPNPKHVVLTVGSFLCDGVLLALLSHFETLYGMVVVVEYQTLHSEKLWGFSMQAESWFIFMILLSFVTEMIVVSTIFEIAHRRMNRPAHP